jgi:hypothetical protein
VERPGGWRNSATHPHRFSISQSFTLRQPASEGRNFKSCVEFGRAIGVGYSRLTQLGAVSTSLITIVEFHSAPASLLPNQVSVWGFHH